MNRTLLNVNKLAIALVTMAILMGSLPIRPAMASGDTLQVPLFYQRNDAKTCGGDGTGNYGCTVSSLAMVFKYYGLDVNPEMIVTANGANGCAPHWSSIAANADPSGRITYNGSFGAIGDVIPLTNRITFDERLTLVKSEIDQGFPPIMYFNNGYQDTAPHGIVGIGYYYNSSNQLIIIVNDPAYHAVQEYNTAVHRNVDYVHTYRGPITPTKTSDKVFDLKWPVVAGAAGYEVKLGDVVFDVGQATTKRIYPYIDNTVTAYKENFWSYRAKMADGSYTNWATNKKFLFTPTLSTEDKVSVVSTTTTTGSPLMIQTYVGRLPGATPNPNDPILVFTRTSTDGVSWSSALVSGATYLPIVTEAFNGKVYQMLTGTDERSYIRQASLTSSNLSWSSWEQTGHSSRVSPTMATNDEAIYFSVVSTGGTIFTRRLDKNSNVQGWTEHGGSVKPVVMMGKNDIMVQTAVDASNTLWTRVIKSDLALNSWQHNGGSKYDVKMAATNNVIFQVITGNDDFVYTRGYVRLLIPGLVDSGQWSSWIKHGKSYLPPVVIGHNNMLVQGLTGVDNILYTNYRYEDTNWSDGSWLGETANGGTSLPVSFSKFDGKIYQTLLGNDGRGYIRSYNPAASWSQAWSGWVDQGSIGQTTSSGSVMSLGVKDRLVQMMTTKAGRRIQRTAFKGNTDALLGWTSWTVF